MFEIAVRINQLVSSNVNSLVDAASNPIKMLKLMIVEIEEAIISLTREAAQCERRVRDLEQQAKQGAKLADEWSEKARFAMAKEREDLARGALVERDNARDAGARAETERTHTAADAERLRETIKQQEQRLREARIRLTAEQQATRKQGAGTGQRRSTASRSEKLVERIDILEKRVDFVSENHNAPPSATARSLDEELAAMARDERIDAELEAMRKAAAKKRK